MRFIFIILLVGGFSKGPSSGYYAYGNHFYYYDNSNWYKWDINEEEWSHTKADNELEENADGDWDSDWFSVANTMSLITKENWTNILFAYKLCSIEITVFYFLCLKPPLCQ